MAKSVYLAGPEVFLPNAREVLDQKIALTREAGLIPVSPGDLEFPNRHEVGAGARHQRHRRETDELGGRDHRQPDAVPRYRG